MLKWRWSSLWPGEAHRLVRRGSSIVTSMVQWHAWELGPRPHSLGTPWLYPAVDSVPCLVLPVIGPLQERLWWPFLLQVIDISGSPKTTASALQGFPGGSEVKASACNAGDLGSTPGLGRSPGEGNGNPLQYSCLENPMDGGAWWATAHGVSKSRSWLSD